MGIQGVEQAGLITEIEQLKASAAFIRLQYPHTIDAVAILGSGLGEFANTLPNAVKLPFGEIPHFPGSTVEGHQGVLCLGEVRPGFHLACLQGRVHFYEGHSQSRVVFPLRVARLLGASTLIVTNSAGGVNLGFKSGQLMLITDHLNLMGTNPLIGENIAELGPRFPDMSQVYTPRLRALALEKAQALNIQLQQGVYAGLTGPSYETPAEIRMLRTLGADAVGMSTVPEVIVASHMGMEVLGISCITNAAAGVEPEHRLSHEEVLETSARARQDFSRLLESIIAAL